MKLLLSAAVILTVSTGAAFAQMSGGAGGGGGGNLHGSEAAGAPINGSYRASAVDPDTGYTVGHGGNRFAPTYNGTRHVSKKKKRTHSSTTGSAGTR